jgi:hypothetical protein
MPLRIPASGSHIGPFLCFDVAKGATPFVVRCCPRTATPASVLHDAILSLMQSGIHGSKPFAKIVSLVHTDGDALALALIA